LNNLDRNDTVRETESEPRLSLRGSGHYHNISSVSDMLHKLSFLTLK